jgi:hypothetical protein
VSYSPTARVATPAFPITNASNTHHYHVITSPRQQARLLCPYLVEQPYLAASEHYLGNTASDARIMLARTVTLFFLLKLTQAFPNSPKLTKTL